MKIIRKNEGTTIRILKDKHVIKIDGLDTNNRLSVIEQTYESMQGSNLHYHKADSHIFYVLEGVFSITLNNILSEIYPGDIVLIPLLTNHSFKVTSKENGKALVFTFPAGIENLFIELGQIKTDELKNNFPEIASKYGVVFDNKK